ncbi:MAG: 50S ribosomal protein L10 [Thermodesulfobacteriota bacterium]|nr:50S ribosomal protein L10 [Thermodesulfobacteriota bacterium]
MDRQEKVKFVADLHNRLEKAQGAFLVDYKGLNVEAMNRLRRELKEAGAEFQVVKNRLLRLAGSETEIDSIKDQMEGPTAIALTYDDIVTPAKVLVDFSKDLPLLKIKNGQISGKAIDTEAITRLAALPGKDVLLAQALSTMQAVPASFVRVLSGVIVKLLNALKAIKDEKENSSEVTGSTLSAAGIHKSEEVSTESTNEHGG